MELQIYHDCHRWTALILTIYHLIAHICVHVFLELKNFIVPVTDGCHTSSQFIISSNKVYPKPVHDSQGLQVGHHVEQNTYRGKSTNHILSEVLWQAPVMWEIIYYQYLCQLRKWLLLHYVLLGFITHCYTVITIGDLYPRQVKDLPNLSFKLHAILSLTQANSWPLIRRVKIGSQKENCTYNRPRPLLKAKPFSYQVASP